LNMRERADVAKPKEKHARVTTVHLGASLAKVHDLEITEHPHTPGLGAYTTEQLYAELIARFDGHF
jgi:Na+-translocating ferredoxin:NAD+ oxidoreductase RnfG subunit